MGLTLCCVLYIGRFSLTQSIRSQLCINSAIVYMHRFYMFHSFSRFHRNLMAPCCLFLACKVEEQPRKLEYLLKVAYNCMNKPETPPMDVKSEVGVLRLEYGLSSELFGLSDSVSLCLPFSGPTFIFSPFVVSVCANYSNYKRLP